MGWGGGEGYLTLILFRRIKGKGNKTQISVSSVPIATTHSLRGEVEGGGALPIIHKLHQISCLFSTGSTGDLFPLKQVVQF